MVEEDFGFTRFEMIQNESFQQDFQRVYSPWLRKILDSDGLKLFKIFLESIFTIVEDNFGFRRSKVIQNLGLQRFSGNLFTMIMVEEDFGF